MFISANAPRVTSGGPGSLSFVLNGHCLVLSFVALFKLEHAIKMNLKYLISAIDFKTEALSGVRKAIPLTRCNSTSAEWA